MAQITAFQKKFNEFALESRREQVAAEIRRSLIVMYPLMGVSDPLVQEMLGELAMHKLEEQLRGLEIETGIYFVATDLEPKFVHLFFQSLVEFLTFNEHDRAFYKKIQKFVQSKEPKLKVLLGRKNEVLPTFISIDATGRFDECLSFLAASVGQALEKREEYSQASSPLNQLKTEVEAAFGVRFIDLETSAIDAVDDRPLSQNKKFLFLRKLSNLLQKARAKETKDRPLEQLKVTLWPNQPEVAADGKELFLNWNFDEREALRLIDGTPATNKI